MWVKPFVLANFRRVSPYLQTSKSETLKRSKCHIVLALAASGLIEKQILTIVYDTIRNDGELRSRAVYVLDSRAEAVEMGQSKLLSLVWDASKDLDLGVGRLEGEGGKAHLDGLVGLHMAVCLRQTGEQTNIRLNTLAAGTLVLIPVDNLNDLCGHINVSVIENAA